MIRFLEGINTENMVKKCIVEISVRNEIILVKVFFLDGQTELVCKEETKNVLKKYFFAVNSLIKNGNFNVDCKNRIVYSLKFYAIYPYSKNKDLYSVIRGCLEIYYLHYESISKLTSKNNYNIEKMIAKGKKLRQEEAKFITISHKLSPEELKLEREIVDRFTKLSTDLFINNRFRYKLIKFHENTVFYNKPDGLDLVSSIDEYSSDIFNHVMELVEDLMKFQIYLKEYFFPLNQFL